jgi:cytochrome c oxidase subunit 2
VDGVPGHVNETWFKVRAGREGIYTGQCAELCGAGHADMRARVRAVTPDEFESWAEETRANIQGAGEELSEERKRRDASEGEEG